MSVSDITTFFSTSTRAENDAANKTREKVLKVICNPPQEYLDHPEFGSSWRTVHTAWNEALKTVAADTAVPPYTSTKIKIMGGRGFNYDALVSYYDGATHVASRKIEFKKGGATIDDQPQFLSLQAKIGLFAVTYDRFWYDNYLDSYIACDSGITAAKPSLELYLKNVTSTRYTITPFFEQLRERELFFQKEKNAVVNASIADYLSKYGESLDMAAFTEKVKATQTDKIYLLWSNGKFSTDQLSEAEMTGMIFHAIKNGNVLQVKAGATMYNMLLRWRNHKGILNPAWQISMKR